MVTRVSIGGWDSGRAPWRGLEDGDVLIIYEPEHPDDALAASLTRHEGGKAPGKVLVAGNPDGLRKAVSDTWSVDASYRIVGDPEAIGRHGAEADVAIRQACETRGTSETTARMNAEAWTRTGLGIAERLPGLPLLATMGRALEGVPAIIVGAGPSLDRAVKAIRKAQGRAAIIATNSAVGPLDRAGIRPDVVCVIEANPASIADVVDCASWREAIVVPGAHADLAAWDAPSRAVLPALQRFGPVGRALCDALGIQPTEVSGTVTSLAVSVALHLGCEPLVLAGVDCAHPEAYASGVGREGAAVREGHERTVPGFGGGTVRTSALFDLYRRWLGGVAAAFDVINVSVGGARIDHTTELQPHQLPVGRWPLVDVQGRILAAARGARRLSAPEVSGVLATHLRASRSYAAATERTLGAARALASELRHLVTEPCGQGSLLEGTDGCPLDDVALLPRLEQVEALVRLMGGYASVWSWLEPALERVIAALGERAAEQEAA